MRSALISALLLLATFASAQVRINPGERASHNAEYRQAVANYCRLDYDGARLSDPGWQRLRPLTTLRDNPEFKRIAVVTRYQIMPEMHSERGRYIFEVQYDISGEYDLAGGYFPGPDRVIVQVSVGEPNGDVRVVETSDARPFIGRPRLQQWLKAKLDTESDSTAKSILEASLQRLQDQARKPESGQ